MTLPTNPPATTTPTALKTWAQAVVDTAADHEERVAALELESSGNVGGLIYLFANYR